MTCNLSLAKGNHRAINSDSLLKFIAPASKEGFPCLSHRCRFVFFSYPGEFPKTCRSTAIGVSAQTQYVACSDSYASMHTRLFLNFASKTTASHRFMYLISSEVVRVFVLFPKWALTAFLKPPVST